MQKFNSIRFFEGAFRSVLHAYAPLLALACTTSLIFMLVFVYFVCFFWHFICSIHKEPTKLYGMAFGNLQHTWTEHRKRHDTTTTTHRRWKRRKRPTVYNECNSFSYYIALYRIQTPMMYICSRIEANIADEKGTHFNSTNHNNSWLSLSCHVPLYS